MTSIFSKIIRREIPAERVYETENELAFLDINPISEGHTLVVPKREVADFDALPPGDLTSLIAAVQTVARGVASAMDSPHYNVTLNNGAAAGQVVFHVHFHVIPRYQGGGRGNLRGPYPEGRLEIVGEAIREALRKLGAAQPER